MTMRRFLLCLLLCDATACAQEPGAELPKLEVLVKRVPFDAQHRYEVDASGTVQAPLATVWKILTTYERMHEFVPDLVSCKVLSRNGNDVVVEQFGTVRFLFMSKSIHLIVRATEVPMSSIDIALVSGDMKQYETRWDLHALPATGGTRIVYSGRMIPNFYVPGLLGAQLIHSDIERMMVAVLARLDSKRD